MAKFIKLTLSDNENIIVNTHWIDCIRIDEDTGVANVFYVNNDDEYYAVKETPEQILELINATN